jgi:hypothetical protein
MRGINFYITITIPASGTACMVHHLQVYQFIFRNINKDARGRAKSYMGKFKDGLNRNGIS